MILDQERLLPLALAEGVAMRDAIVELECLIVEARAKKDFQLVSVLSRRRAEAYDTLRRMGLSELP